MRYRQGKGFDGKGRRTNQKCSKLLQEVPVCVFLCLFSSRRIKMGETEGKLSQIINVARIAKLPYPNCNFKWICQVGWSSYPDCNVRWVWGHWPTRSGSLPWSVPVCPADLENQRIVKAIHMFGSWRLWCFIMCYVSLYCAIVSYCKSHLPK